MDRKSVRPKLLIADDDDGVRNVLARAFSLESYRVVTVEDGAQALAAALDQPDLLILDLNLPVKSGFEVLRELRSNDETKGLPVILLTGVAGNDLEVLGLDAGADDYLAKPFALQELRARVRSVLRRHQRLHSVPRG